MLILFYFSDDQIVRLRNHRIYCATGTGGASWARNSSPVYLRQLSVGLMFFRWNLIPFGLISRLDKHRPAVDYSHLHERSFL